MSRKSGFSLMEMLVTLAVISIVATISVPFIVGWLPNYRLKSTVREIQSIVQYSRMRAIRETCNVVVTFDPGQTGANDFIVFLDNGAGTNSGNFLREADETVIRTGRFLPGVTPVAGGIAFDGSTPGANSQKFRFDSRGTVNGVAGFIRLQSNTATYAGVNVRPTGISRIITSKTGLPNSWS